jgi:hypothetical protein
MTSGGAIVPDSQAADNSPHTREPDAKLLGSKKRMPLFVFGGTVVVAPLPTPF